MLSERSRAWEAASGYALHSFPGASASTEKEINHHRLDLYLSTIGRADSGLPSLVNIQSAQVVNIRSAGTLNNHQLKLVGLYCGLEVRIRVA